MDGVDGVDGHVGRSGGNKAKEVLNLPLMILQKMQEGSLWVAIFLAAAADQGRGIDGVKREALAVVVGRGVGVLSSKFRVVVAVVVVMKGRNRCM